MAENFNNLDTREKENLMSALGAAQNATATFADVGGDSFTGLVNFTTLTSSGNASLSSANIPTLAGANMAYTGTASLAVANIPTLAGANLAYTGTASLATANIPTLKGSIAALGSLASINAANIYSSVGTVESLILGGSPVLGSATIAPLRIIASTASQACISFSGVFLSSASYGATNAFVIPVYHESQRIWGYLSANKVV